MCHFVTRKFTLLVSVPLGVVALALPVVAPVGTVVVIKEAETTLKTAAVPLNVTLVAPVGFVPRILTAAPTAGGGLCFHKRAQIHGQAEDCAIAVGSAKQRCPVEFGRLRSTVSCVANEQTLAPLREKNGPVFTQMHEAHDRKIFLTCFAVERRGKIDRSNRSERTSCVRRRFIEGERIKAGMATNRQRTARQLATKVDCPQAIAGNPKLVGEEKTNARIAEIDVVT